MNEKYPTKKKHLAFKVLNDETIILDTKIGKEVHQLNSMGTFIWNLCDGNNLKSDILIELVENFEEDISVLTTDLEIFLNLLENKSLIEWNDVV